MAITEKLKSRKLWVTILGALLAVFRPEIAALLLKWGIAPYVLGQSIVDASAAKRP